MDRDLKWNRPIILDLVHPINTVALLPQIPHVMTNFPRYLRNIQSPTHLIEPLKTTLPKQTFILLLLKRLGETIQSLSVLTLVKYDRLVRHNRLEHVWCI